MCVCLKNAFMLRSEPTQALADAIHISLTSGKNLETNAILFKFAWRLFTRDDDGDTTRIELGGRALSAAPHLICAIETAVRSSKGGRKYTKYAEAREICFKAMIEYMGPSGGEMKYDSLPCRGYLLELTYCVA